MQVTTFLLASLASFVAAQTATTTASASAASTSCAAQNILDACMATEQAQVNSCAQTDYSCLCTQYGNLLTCYNNCPNDPGATTVQQDREQYCNAAAVDGSTTTMGVVSATNASTAASIIATSASITSGESIASSTGTSSSATASSTPSQHNGVTRTEMENSLIVVALAGLGLVL